MLSFHSFLAGAALGTASEIATSIVVLIAILAHKWAAAFALAVKLKKSDAGRATQFTCFLVFVALFPLGVFMGDLVLAGESSAPLAEPIFASMAAGTFLYLGTLHGLAGSTLVARCCNVDEFTLVAIGFALMAVVAIWT